MGPSRLTLLLVQDSPVSDRLMAGWLSQAGGPGCQIEHATSVTDALTILASTSVDLIVLDLDLPEDRRLCAFRSLHAAHPVVPVIVLSTTGDDELAMLVMQAGAQDFLVRERLNAETLRASVRCAIARGRVLGGEQSEHAVTRAAERRFRQLLQSIDAIVWEMDFSTWQFSYVSQRAEDILGYPVDEWLQTPGFLLDHLHPDDREAMVACSQEIVAGTAHSFEVRVFAADGRIVWMLGSVMHAPSGSGSGLLGGMMVDITKRKLSELLEREQSDILTQVAKSLPPAQVLSRVALLVENQCQGGVCCIFLLKHGQVTLAAGPHLETGFLLGLRRLKWGTRCAEHNAFAADGEEDASWASFRALADEFGMQIQASATIRSGQGEEEVEGLIVVHGRRDAPGPEVLPLVLHTASRLASLVVTHAALGDQLQHQAQHDALTGLPNRLLFADRLSQALLQARRQEQRLAVMFIDLDGFKRINDTLGHGAGDELLCLAAERFQSVMRRSDTLARMGGDEFMVVLNAIRGSQDTARVAQLILASLEEPFKVSGHELYLTASIGISFFPDDATDVATLQGHADAAMYQAKASGRNCMRCYTEELNAQLVDRMQLEDQLRHAIERNEILLQFQPLYRAAGTLLGFEALVRWEHPVHGMIAPSRFIPIAEESGIIHALGRWVLREACRNCAAWRAAGHGDLKVAVNVSALQFQNEGWLDVVAETLAETGLEPIGLELELTEGIVMEQATDSIRHLRAIKALGVSIAIDDFGTGYSSLAYLQRLPIDTLKIDQNFIFNLRPELDEQNSLRIVEAIIALAHGLGLQVLAEGVETEAQWTCLQELGCHAMQGFYCGRPMTHEECDVLLGTCRPREALVVA